MSSSIHRHTPKLTVTDPRRLALATVTYHRVMSNEPTRTRTERQCYDCAGRMRAQWDARLWDQDGEFGVANQRKTLSLGGLVLGLDSVDAGWRIDLFGTSGQALAQWDGRGTYTLKTYDTRLRPLTVLEQMAGEAPKCVERLDYGLPTDTHNLCGQLARHDDPAGTLAIVDYALTGHVAAQAQQFLQQLTPPDWPASLEERDRLLEPERFLTRRRHDSTGALVSQTDPGGNEQRIGYNLAGQMAHVSLVAKDAALQVIASDIAYNPSGQIESQKAGNRVFTQATYAADNGRLLHLHTARTDQVLQDLYLVQDPVGNVLTLEDRAQPTQWFDAQQIDPINTYQYDTLNQLVQATGRESVLAGIHPGLPELVVPGAGDPSRLRNYTQHYTYDDAGNLCTLKHGDAPVRTMKVALHSNRSLYIADATNPPDLEKGFDSNGNMLWLDGAQTMHWNARNQLQRVTQIVRRDANNDDELYVYHGDGQRARKVRVKQAKTAEHVTQVLYLPGLEIRRNTATGEELHVMTVDAGRSRVRRLNWRSKGRHASPEAHLRYSVDDQLGSCTLELDDHGEVITHEAYYPFGGSAWWAAKSQSHADSKTIRFSGRELDASGLYYYGLRYYAPWLARWINPDPGGDIDGLNLFRMARNNPLRFRDDDGRNPDDFVEYLDDFPGANAPGYPPDSRPFRRRDVSVADATQLQKAVDAEFTHRHEGRFTILSSYKNQSGMYRFENEFLPGRWRMMENYRAPGTSINATTVTFEQYRKVATENNFFGVLPNVIVRWDVKDEYIDSLLEGGQEGLLQRFLASKNNGTSTRHIIAALGMCATGIEIVTSRDSERKVDVNAIAITVEPNRRKSVETLTQETERDIRRLSRNPVSRFAHSAWRMVRNALRRDSARPALR